MTRQDTLAVAALATGTLVAAFAVEVAPPARWIEPPYAAVVAYVGALVVLTVLRVRGDVRGERLFLAQFLAAMALIYVANGLLTGAGPAWMAVELVGVVVFGALAVVGWRSAYRVLAVGIVLHGVWDLAHHGHSPHMPDWYALACAAVDVGLGGYAWIRAIAEPA